MALAEQIFTFINAVTNQALGNTGVVATDTSSLVALGREVMADEGSISKFYSALANQIGRTYVAYRALPENRLGLMRTPLEFGAILRTLEIKTIARTQSNASWDSNNPITEQIFQDTTDVVAEYFEARGTFEITPKVVYDFQLKTAFSDAASLGAFVDMIFQDMYNGMELAIRDMENTTLCTAIALCASVETEKQTCINLLATYNKDFGKTLTAAAAYRDPDFLRYAAAEIKKHKKYMEDPSVFYNPKGYETWTPAEACQVHMLEHFASNLTTYLQSDTFHSEMVALPSYRERSYWQGIGDNSVADRAKVSIENGDLAAELNGVLAFIFDYDMVAIMVDFIRTKSDYKPRFEHTEYYHKADWASCVRGSKQGIVFYIDDYAPIVKEEPADWASKALTDYYVKNMLGEYTLNTESTFSTDKTYYKKVN